MIKLGWPETKSRASDYSSLLECRRWALWNRGCRSQKWQNTCPVLYEKRNATTDTSRPHGIEKIQTMSKRCTILPRNQLHDIEMQHLLRASTTKHERANDPLSHAKQALGNGRHRLVHLGQTWIPDNCWLSLKSTTVITHTKSMFARHGILSEVISDNGPQFFSKDFSLFAKQWEFKHTTVSPQYPQENGLVEKGAQRVKRLLTKAKQARRDPYLRLLEYRNTPIDDIGSPAKLLRSRRLRAIIPTTDAQLQPRVLDPHKVKEKLRLKQENQSTILISMPNISPP